MKPSVIITLGLLCSSAFATPPEIDQKLPLAAEPYMLAGHRPWVITDTGAGLETFRITRNGHHYLVGVDQSHKISYITLAGDRTFKTPEGVALDSPLSVVTAATKHAPVKVSRWGCYYLPLPSGWNAAFVGSPQGPRPAGAPPAKVNFLFKSRTAKRCGLTMR